MIADGNTDSVNVENPVFRAFNADLIIPVPDFAAQIRRVDVGSQVALSIFEDVSTVAAKTSSGKGIPGVAVVTDRGTDTIGIEKGSVRAGKADGLVESFAERVFSGNEGVGVSDALSLIDDVSGVA